MPAQFPAQEPDSYMENSVLDLPHEDLGEVCKIYLFLGLGFLMQLDIDFHEPLGVRLMFSYSNPSNVILLIGWRNLSTSLQALFNSTFRSFIFRFSPS